MNTVKKSIEIALIAFTSGDNILLNKRADATSEMWEFIGGGVESGESPRQAIQREVFEEVGYQLSEKDDLQFSRTISFEDERIVAKVHLFTALFPGFEYFSDSDEVFVKDLKLFNTKEALNLTLLPITRRIIEDGVV